MSRTSSCEQNSRLVASYIHTTMVDSLISKTLAVEAFLYDGLKLESILEDYKLTRQQKEEDKKRFHPLLIQFPMFHNGRAVKGTVLINKKVLPFPDTKNRSYVYSVLLVACPLCGAYFVGDLLITNGYREKLSKWYVQNSHTDERRTHDACQEIKSSTNLLAIAVMLFHYDNVVDEWRDLGWNDKVIHICATNQTKGWFAKGILHPDIIAEYDYIFLWDQDLTVEDFHPQRYLDIIKSEGLEISQPALDPLKSVIHHPMTARNKHSVIRCIGFCIHLQAATISKMMKS